MQVQILRIKRGWSQQQLADLSGLSVRTIQRIESGHPASMESLKALASVFEIDFTTLNREPDLNPSPVVATPSPMVQPPLGSALPGAAASAQLDPASPMHAARLEEQLALAHVRRVRGFYRHLVQYVLVIAGLAVLNLVTSPGHLWVIWPALGWGIGMVAHAASVFELVPFLGADWERKQVERRLGRPL